MKILFTGGGTGGHFYPIIAIAEKVNQIIDKEKIIGAKLYFVSTSPYDKNALFENGIIFEQVNAGKMRTYFSLLNFFDFFKTGVGIIEALIKVFTIYPDVIFGKGGYASFPVLFAAKILRIPVVIHESDCAPGRVNLWASKFAKAIAISYDEAGEYFPKDKTVLTGQPIRSEITHIEKEGAFEYLKLNPSMPVLFVLGGSQGAEIINNTVIDALPELLKRYQIIHQVGTNNVENTNERVSVILTDELKDRYKSFGFLNSLAIKMSAGASTLVISRAGSTIFEIASWGLPSILIPFNKSNGDHARKNAFNYARAGACDVIEETNLTPNILIQEVDKLIANKTRLESMAKNAKNFGKPDAAEKIAKELVDIALSHEQ